MKRLDLADREGTYREDFGRLESRVRRRSRAALQPISFTAKRDDGGVLFRIVDRDPIIEGQGAVRYDILWAADVNLSTAETIAAGFARAVQVLSIPAPGKANAEAARHLFGERYLIGYYFCVGYDSTNTPGEPTPPIAMGDTSTGGGYPDDVSHFSISESGEVHNGVPYSVISFIYQAPNDSRFAGVKFFVKDYPVINEIYQTHFHRHVGQLGGTGQDKFKWEVGRRKGTGRLLQIATVNIIGSGAPATKFRSEMNAGDYIEARGHTQEIGTVYTTTDFLALLSANWTGPNVVDLDDWWIIPLVTIYAVSVGKDGSHREDVTNAPSVTVLLDGLLSAPVAPVLTGNYDANGVSTLGEINRLEWDQLAGTEIKAYHLYRGLGAAAAFVDCTHIGTRMHDANNLAGGHHSFDDKDFTITQKEQNQVFSYYLVAENWREQRSSPSSRVEVACRLNNAGSGDPTIPSRSGVKTLLYNGAFAGTVGNNVDDLDVSQDTFNADVARIGAGWNRWESGVSGGAVTRPKHIANDQVIFAPPGAGGSARLWQGVKAWEAAADPIIKEGAVLTFQALIKHDGTLPDGTFTMYLESLDAVQAHNEYCPRRYRDPADDALKWTAATSAAILTVPVASLLSTWQLFFAVFLPSTTAALDIAELRVNWGWDDGTVGNIYVTQPMLSYGEELANWSGEMVERLMRHPRSGDPVGPIGDGPGHRRELIRIP